MRTSAKLSPLHISFEAINADCEQKGLTITFKVYRQESTQ